MPSLTAMSSSAPPLFAERPFPVQVVGGIVVPAVFGTVVGLVLGWSETWYWVLSAVGLVGGLLGGLEHRGAVDGGERGFASGVVFGAFLLLAHAIHGEPAEAQIGQMPGLLPLVAGIVTAFFGAIGGALRGRASA